MAKLLHEIILRQAISTPDNIALGYREQQFDYRSLASAVCSVAGGLQKRGLIRNDRVGIYLPKVPEAVFSYFGTIAAGGVMVPVNPVLKASQVGHILQDCSIRFLITSQSRYKLLQQELSRCPALDQVILIDGESDNGNDWYSFLAEQDFDTDTGTVDVDMAAILYTSGSTGKPRGVVLSHRNMVCGAYSVAEYLENDPEDRLLCVLPFSFDYGFSQLTTSFAAGASCYLLEYLLPVDIFRAVENYRITGLGLVPPLWVQLSSIDVSKYNLQSLRYFTNSGGVLPVPILEKLRLLFPAASPFLMYGLTEAFRSTYLPPKELDRKSGSMGRAIPNAEILVMNDQGNECAVNEPGELVHRGSLVAMGYWNDLEKTQQRFRQSPRQVREIPCSEVAVWSGDTVRKDSEGFLYFLGRRDELIKTSGYRVSPGEVEEVVYKSDWVDEALALGVPHPVLGQAIILIIVSRKNTETLKKDLMSLCRYQLPGYMVPKKIIQVDQLPRNHNGKLDRQRQVRKYQSLYCGTES